MRTAVVDTTTGLMTTPWALFFQNVFSAIGGGSTGGVTDGLQSLLSDEVEGSSATLDITSSLPYLGSLLSDPQQDLGDSGVIPGIYTNTDLTVDARGIITAASSGSIGNGNYTKTVSVDGTALVYDDATKIQWGVSGPSPTGVPKSSVAVTFPVPFLAPPSVVTSPDNYPDGATADPFECYPTNISTVGFTANFFCTILIGGSGASNITYPAHCNWHASGD